MTNGERRQQGVWTDLRALRRFFWLPALTVVLGILAALALSSFTTASAEARFRANVVIDAVPPLFGPPVLPGPFDYAALAMSDDVVDDIATATNNDSIALRARLKAEPRVNSPEITFTVTGGDALTVARAWEVSFSSAVVAETAGIQQALIEPYRAQLAQAGTQLQSAAAAAQSNAGDPVRAQELSAAEANYETAARLVQSYDVVTATIQAKSFTSSPPHLYGPRVGSTPARVAAGALIGLIAGVLGALGLTAAQAGRSTRDDDRALPSDLRRAHERAETSS